MQHLMSQKLDMFDSFTDRGELIRRHIGFFLIIIHYYTMMTLQSDLLLPGGPVSIRQGVVILRVIN